MFSVNKSQKELVWIKLKFVRKDMIGADSDDAADKTFSVGKFMEADGDDRWCFQVIFLLSKNVISLELSELRF